MSHTVTCPPLDGRLVEPDIAATTFHDALDVVAFAEVGGVCVGRPRCSTWHLDATGSFRCGTRGCGSDRLDRWAADPARLIDAFTRGVDDRPCGPRWVIIDERCTSPDPGPGDAVDEGDVEHFLRLRCALATVGADLVDAVVFDRGRWWSMCELLTGSTRWGAVQLPCPDLRSGSFGGIVTGRSRRVLCGHEDLASERTG